ncbi:MAG: hypothetical protein AB1941_16845 [Gemmatimonadota bacterium]
MEADPGEDVVIAWDVSNRTNAPRNLVVTPSDPHPAVLPRRAADLSGVSAFASSQTKAAAVTYRLTDAAEGGQSYPVEISAHDQEDPTRSATDVVHVRARLILAAPSISVSPAGERTEEPGIPFTLTWTVRNESNAARLLELVPSVDAGALELVSSEGAGRVTVPKRATATVTATYRVRPGATAPGRSLALLEATDVADSSLRTDARVAVNTALVRRAPSVSTPTDQTLSPGAALDVAWTVKNESNATRTLTISPSAGADLSVESATNSGTVTFAAGEEKTVTVRYRLAATSEAGTVRVAPLTVADQDGAPYTSSESFRVTTALVLAAPTVGAPIARTRTPGTSESVPFTVRNNSNATRTIELVPSSSSAAVAGVPTPSPASVTLPAWGSASVSLTYQVESQVPGGATAEIALQARDAGAREHAGAAGFTLTAATVLRAPTQSTPADQVRAQGESFTGSWTVSNPSNVARSYSITPAAAAGITITGGTNTGSVTVPAFGAITVTVNYSMSAAAEGGSSRTATLSTSDVGGAGAVSSSFTVRTADVEGCQDPDGQNFNPTANVAGSCTYSWGCMDPGSSNYDPLAKQDDGSCYVLGCTHSWADNYNRGATRDDGSCYKRGCTASWANNYDPQATQDNGTCYRNGCTTSSASNYDGLATRDDGSCYWLGCTDPNARNYSSTATRNDGSCVAHVDGCTDPRAVNYNASATRDNGTCTYTVPGCTASWADNFNPSATQDDGSCYKRGCMDASATNYDPKATTSEGATCYYPPEETRTVQKQQGCTYYHVGGQYRATENFACTVTKKYGAGGAVSYTYSGDCVSRLSGTYSHMKVGDNPDQLETRSQECPACIWGHEWCGQKEDFKF